MAQWSDRWITAHLKNMAPETCAYDAIFLHVLFLPYKEQFFFALAR